MARKSRKETAAVAVQETDAACRAAIYVRLSVEDTHTHSVSIETQQMIIARYLEQYPEISVYDTYIDNGATGTNFHRPGFQQMLSDIEAGHVNCVIVKDLSRLGRNTIDTGYYIEQYFRIRSIRFIAVNENFDTAAPEDAHSGIIIPLRNMINEAYALDIGRKIRAQQRQAMKDGKFIGARTPYGYLKAEDDCHQLIIDPVAAVVVQRMFRWASEGAGLNTIAVRLNEAGILTPSHYKKMQGKITHENLLGSGKWQTRTVGVILRSEVYTGDLVQGQTKTVDHRQVKADAEEWTVVRDTHEAIISREQFAAVQEILNQTASRAKAREVKAFTPNLLKGKVFCAHCGGSLHRQRNIRKKSDDVYFYHCLSQSRISKDACPGVTIREDALLDMLADMLQDALDTALGQYTLSLAELPRQAADRAELREKITSRKQEIQRLRGIVRSLYENLVQGVLTKDEYFDYKEKYESCIADLAVEMEQLEDGLRTMGTQVEQHRALEQDAAQIKTDCALTGALIERLIDRIEVGNLVLHGEVVGIAAAYHAKHRWLPCVFAVVTGTARKFHRCGHSCAAFDGKAFDPLHAGRDGHIGAAAKAVQRRAFDHQRIGGDHAAGRDGQQRAGAPIRQAAALAAEPRIIQCHGNTLQWAASKDTVADLLQRGRDVQLQLRVIAHCCHECQRLHAPQTLRQHQTAHLLLREGAAANALHGRRNSQLLQRQAIESKRADGADRSVIGDDAVPAAQHQLTVPLANEAVILCVKAGIAVLHGDAVNARRHHVEAQITAVADALHAARDNQIAAAKHLVERSSDNLQNNGVMTHSVSSFVRVV